MFRRSFLQGLALVSTLPFIPARLDPTPERLPADGQLMFWFHFRQAVVQGTLSTERAREHVVEDLELTRCSREDAKRALELASTGYYGLDVVPVGWCDYFDRVDTIERDRAETP